MIEIRDLHLRFGERVIFNQLSCTVRNSHKIGLVGANGVGKTTLIRLLTNEILPDEGVIDMPKTEKMGYLRQEIELQGNRSVIDEVMSVREIMETTVKEYLEIKENLP